jgi:hypothetical protein
MTPKPAFGGADFDETMTDQLGGRAAGFADDPRSRMEGRQRQGA